MTELSMNPADWIPHRAPFLLIDRLLSIEPGVAATGEWALTGGEWFFPGHFPGRPTTPGVLMLESMAQVGAVAVLADERYRGRLPLFGGVEKARFRRQVLPGETLTVSCVMSRVSARGGKGHASAHVGSQLAVEADILFIFADA
jgi:3-hydroxyacyl-[acyl-carrier-protein] dehydratase